MNHKLRPQRLSQLYADIDLPVFDPAEHTLQIRQASESLPSQVESQSSDVILLPEKNQMDFADSHAAADVLGVATVSMSAHTMHDLNFCIYPIIISHDEYCFFSSLQSATQA